jgi:hypothetical protein
VVQELPGETLVYDSERHQAHCLNQSAALLWKMCDGEKSVPEIARQLGKELGTPVDETTVWYGLKQLAKFHLLEEEVAPPQVVLGMSRRDFVRKAGITAAIAIPVISTIVAPTAASAASCLPTGSMCGTGAQCCSLQCVGGFCL